MGARARGLVAISSPLALQPVATPVRVHFQILVAFFTGFLTTFVVFIWWLWEGGFLPVAGIGACW